MATPLNSLDIAKPPGDTRVVVAMSGGVDSSVVAAVLAAEGYDVVGVTLKLYDDGRAAARKGSCCAGRDITDARAAAARLGIPHYVLDYTARFRDSVITPFAAAYAAGETPVPCALCNSAVKFTDLLGMARDLDADVMATGHYCATRRLPDGRRGLFRAADASRDQSYFLFATTPQQLAFVRFPLGDLPKSRVREMARAHALSNADKPDSQDICFVPDGRYASTVARMLPDAVRSGAIVDEDGAVVGRHDGIHQFTVGQRRGLSLGGREEPLFVLRLDPRRREVVVGPRRALAIRRLALRDVNWLGDGRFEDAGPDGLSVWVKTRSTRPPIPATVFPDGQVEFPRDETAVSAGQACVFYDGDRDGARVLGGGTVMNEAALFDRLEPASFDRAARSGSRR